MRSIRPGELVVPDLLDREREKLVLPFEEETEKLKDSFRDGERDMMDFYVRMAESDAPEEMRGEVLDRAMSWRRSGKSLAASSLRSYEIADEVSARFNDLTKARKKSRLPLLGRAPANAVIDLEEEPSRLLALALRSVSISSSGVSSKP